MREIKFRAWYKTDKKMLLSGYLPDKNEDEGYYLSLSFEGKLTIAVNDDGGKSGLWEHECHGWEEDFILMQYTGLKDKNDKEIYEGDIVRMVLRENIGTFNVPDEIVANNGYTGREEIYTGEVIFKSAYFGINDEESGHMMFMLDEDTFLEIIGNIYENPEFLKEVKE